MAFWRTSGFGRVSFGRRAEILGALYLRTIGYRLLACPYRSADGEVDIVARDGASLVFVEVKARRHDLHPEDAVNIRKQRKIIQVARAYRRRYNLDDEGYRFDILAVIEPSGQKARYRLIKDAFLERSEDDHHDRRRLSPGANPAS